MNTLEPQSSLPPVYVGECRLLRYFPLSLLIVATITLASGNAAGALVFGVPAVLVSVLIPWRFAVFRGGIALWFGFGKHRFLARENVTIRATLGSAVVLPRGVQRFGYPLTDGLVERDHSELRAVLAENGFELAD
jgi:uncharacterized protein (DUF58 family)